MHVKQAEMKTPKRPNSVWVFFLILQEYLHRTKVCSKKICNVCFRCPYFDRCPVA